MKLFFIFFFLFFLHVEAQRRTQTRQEPTNIEQPIRSRGRSRFSSPEYAVISEDTNRRAPSRRRPDSIPSRQAHSSSISSTTVSYAVEENVDESIPVVKPSIVTESKYETPNYPSKPLDIEIPLEGDKTSKEVSKSNENPLEDEGIPTVQIDEEKIAESRADLELESQKPEEKLVPITRNNVRYGGNGNAKRTDDRNTGTRSEGDRGFGNFHNEIIVPRSSARTRGNISPRNGSPRTSNLLQNQIPMTKPSTGNGLSIANADISNSAEDRDIRKEIVRTSVPRISSAAGIPTEITRSALPVKTVRKITRHRLSSNSHAEESVPTFRPRTNTRVVEDYVPVPKMIENRMDDFEDSQRTNSNQKQVEEYTQPSRSRSSPSSRELEYASPQRTRTNNAKNEEPSNSIRSNPRAAKKLTDPKPSDEVPVRTNRRGGRRRPEISTTSAPYPRRGPSVFSTSDDIASTRSRTGRKITRVEPDTNKQVDSRQTSRSRNSRPVTENIETPVERSTTSSRRQGSRLRTEAPSSRHRFNGRTLSNIDETKLEVLPLFEGETKIISEPRRRTNQFASPSISDNKRVEIRESVVSEVTEVTSKRTITRKPLRRPTENKYSQTKSNTLTSSEEDISDADNYPEPYKALLQSKKFAKGSRSSNAQKVSGKIVEKIVSSTESIKTTITTPQDPLIELGEELENEVQPTTPTTSRTIKPNSKYSEYLKNRKASTPSRKFPSRSTLAPFESKPIKFNSKLNSVTKNENTSTKKPIKTFKHKEYQKNLYNKTRSSSDNGNNRGQTSQTTVPKGAKYSSRYRTNGPSRSIIRSSTAPPAYVPTIPAVISNRPTVKSQEDPELGLEFITFDAPVRSISSANLINEEYQPSSPDANLNYLESTQGKNAVTAKTSASIIERIITSIYGVNITTNSTNSDSKSLGTEEPTENSAILSLTPKYSARKSQESNNSSHLKNKSNKRDASTSEKPTTVIQRILNSLSAIQATTTETTMIVTTDGHKAAEQVGTNFNTLSYGNTTPSNLDRETASFPSTLALSSTINPLVVFDTISDEQILQKRTIGKLLNILNSLTTPHPDFTTKFSDTTKLVYVTPKSFSYVNPTSLMTSSGTMKPMIDSSTNTVTTSTSESSTESFTSMSNTLSTEIPASETVTTEISTSTIPGMSSTSDAPLSTTLPTVNNVLLSTSTRSSVPIVMNIASLLSTTTGSPSSMNSNDSNSNSSTTASMLTTTMPSTLTTSTLDSSTQQSTMATEINANITEADGTETLITSTESTLLDISTIPIFPKFEVSPDSVTIFSANDILSNAITPDDILTTTILSPSRLADAFITTERTTFSPFDLDQFSTQGRLTSTPIDTVATTDFVTTTESMDSSTLGDMNGTTVSADVSMETKNVTAAISNNNTAVPNSGRSGKLLQRIEDDLSNSIDSSSMGPDYFIFAVLPNNTILRKKPITYPKETPFVIVGVYPNNTVIRKFPNGTLVPMEPVIRVSGFDTRPNPPPLPDITSNQVTPDQGDRMDNPNLDTVSSMSRNASSDNVNNNNINNITPPSTSKPVSMKVSTMKTVGTTVQSIQNETTTKKTVSSNTIIPDNVTRSSTPISTTPLPSITELLNGKIVQEFNNIVNITPSSQETTTTTTTTIKAETTTTSTTPKITVAPFFTQTTATPSFLNTILSTLQSIGTTSKPSRNKLTTLSPVRFSSTYRAPYLSPPSKATTPTPITTTSTTVRSITTAPRTTTAIPPTTTPSAVDSTPPTPFTSKPAVLSGNEHFSTVFPYFNPDELPLLSILSTERPRRTNALENSTTKKKIPTSQGSKKLQSETSKIEEVTESLEELLKKPIDSIKPKKKLTEQQKKDLETVRQLEKEQAAILKQLSFLTNLNLNGNSGGSSDDLAKKIVNLGKERDSRKIKSSTTSRSTTKPTTSAPPKPSEPPRTKDKAEIDAEATRMKQIENLIKLLNMNGVTPSPNKASTYGTSNDAILASLLKERGIGPTTPKQLAEQIEQLGFFTEALEVTTKPTRKPKSTTQPTRGPLINWLLSAFAPPSTKAPARKSKPKRPRTTTEADLDLLTNEATESTPVATTSPPKKKSVSQNDIQKLIRQLETIQKDPSAAKNFDFATFKNLQNLNSENVQVFMPGSSGVSQRETTKTITRSVTPRSRSTSTIDPLREAHTSKELNRAVRTSTYSPTPVSNSLFDDVDDIVTTQKGRVTLPPVKLRPVNGVSDDAGSVVRGRLLTAAVNVTRALSGFLGSALQGAASSFQTIMASGSRLVGNFAQGSSAMINDTGE